ncbi:transcriptional regulator, TetR family [Gracilibacillus ureilyticus]|uniref:Transcriptional regulator, TetR family n=1 Tax=Gracilibacillus ureilyticus TaxID=531814 RepID=A0A1H9P892_9BACI|nr:TetR/AcrR family transcriptional regulator [Gracilibacillus ureilyticus]SER44009.1 transcriptional regulator, TetR family [Gracilibacillus ureilyticus]
MAARRAVEQELTRQMIIDVAHELFVEEGYQNVSMRKIARSLGYSHGAIYYHFKNKADLLTAMVDQDFAMINNEIDKLDHLNMKNEEKLRQLLLGYIQFGVNHKHHYEVMFMIRDKEVNSHTMESPNKSYYRFSKKVAELTNNQLPVTVIWSVFLMLHGFVAQYCRTDQSYENIRGLAETHVHLILRAINN